MEKQLKTRIQHKIDTYENWEKAINFTPLKGEIIIYTTDENGYDKVGLKIGNGKDNVKDLPFVETAAAGGAGGGATTPQIQSDWLQENSSKKDYIKNKPFYEEELNINWDGTETENFFTAFGLTVYKVNDFKAEKYIIGSKYTNNFKSGLSYELDITTNNMVHLFDVDGNVTNSYLVIDQNEPIFGVIEKAGEYYFNGMQLIVPSGGIWFGKDEDTINITLKNNIIKTIDEKFLPDSIQANWEQFNQDKVDYIQNKPFFETCQSFKMKKDNIMNYKPFELDIWNLSNYKEKLGILGDGIFERVESYKVSNEILSEEELFGSSLYFLSTESVPFFKLGIDLLTIIPLNEEFFDENNIIYSDNDCVITMFFTMSNTAKTVTLDSGEIINIPSKGTYFNCSFDEMGGSVIKITSNNVIDLNNTLILDLDDDTTLLAQKVSEDFIPSDYLLQSTFSLSLKETFIKIDASKIITLEEEFLTPEIIPEGWILLMDGDMPLAVSLMSDAILPMPDGNNFIPLEAGTYLISIQDKNSKETLCECSEIFRQDIIKKIDNKFLPKISTFNTSYIATNIVPAADENLEVDAIMCNLYQFLVNAMAVGVLDKTDLLFNDMQFANTLVIKNAGGIQGIQFGNITAKNGESIVLGIPGDLELGENILDFSGITFCKTIILDTVILDADKPFDIIAIVNPADPRTYAGHVVYGGGGEGDNIIIDQSVQENSEYAVSSKAVYEAIQNIKITTDAEIVQNSTNPVSGGAVYDSLQGYKIRVSDRAPTEEDNIDDNIITFVF